MGLYVHTLGELPTSAERKYYLYLLDYGWEEPLGEAVRKNLPQMMDRASRADAVVVYGPRSVHFGDEVLSWHHINGEPSEGLLPSLLITTRHPSTFRDFDGPDGGGRQASDALLLIPLKKVCKSAQDVADLVQQIFEDIEAEKPLTGFRIKSEMKKRAGRSIVDAVVLEPNIAGVGVDVKKVLQGLFELVGPKKRQR